MSVQPVSDCLFLSSFCSFQERGQRLWRGRKKISESKRACDISGPVSGLYYAVIKCVFHSDYSSRFCWPDVVRTALQLIFVVCEFSCYSVHMVCNIFRCAWWFFLSSQRHPSGSVAITERFWPAKWDTTKRTNQILSVSVYPGLRTCFTSIPQLLRNIVLTIQQLTLTYVKTPFFRHYLSHWTWIVNSVVKWRLFWDWLIHTWWANDQGQLLELCLILFEQVLWSGELNPHVFPTLHDAV